MVKIKVNGYNSNEVRIFDILSKDELENKIDDVNPYDVYKKTLEKAFGYSYNMSGIAYTYLDARDGSIKTNWLQQNNFLHPFDEFYEIVLCTIKTPVYDPDEEQLLDDQEYDEFIEFRNEEGGDIKEFFINKYGEEKGKKEYEERIDNWMDWLATEFALDWDDIERQIDELYLTEVY